MHLHGSARKKGEPYFFSFLKKEIAERAEQPPMEGRKEHAQTREKTKEMRIRRVWYKKGV